MNVTTRCIQCKSMQDVDEMVIDDDGITLYLACGHITRKFFES